MSRKEGVIKYHLDFSREACVTADMIAGLEAWRHILHRLELIGRSPGRYDGLGFGNLSVRLPDLGNPCRFLVTGSQTGGVSSLSEEHYALVTECEPRTNHIRAKGLVKPSSEALTHGQLYRLDPGINAVVHAHSPEIWEQANQLGIPRTDPKALYGSVELIDEVERLFRKEKRARKKRIFVMGGHLDGVVSYGANVKEACQVLVAALADACTRKSVDR